MAKATTAVTADPAVKKRYLDNAQTRGAALWLLSPTEETSNRFVLLLAYCDFFYLRYYAETMA